LLRVLSRPAALHALAAQAFNDPNRVNYMKTQRTLEINPRHPLIRALREKVRQQSCQASRALLLSGTNPRAPSPGG
jgi:HSP90 family molecular chaperone